MIPKNVYQVNKKILTMVYLCDIICLQENKKERSDIMNDEKFKIIKSSISEYKKLPKDKQMFVLGVMQGILLNQTEKKSKETVQTV